MAVSPELASGLAQAVVDAYLEAERALLERIARSIAEGIDAPAWAERQLFAVQSYRRQAEALLVELERTAALAVDEAVTTAANRGTAAAAAEVAVLLQRPVDDLLGALPGQRAVVRLVTEAVGQVTGTHPRILRATTDVYRQIIADVSSRALLGAETRRDTAQAALDRFASKGITGFVDTAGRGWSLTAYTEMATRTATTNALIQAHTERLTTAGYDLVVVSDAPQECAICRPFEGKILSLTGSVVGAISREHATQDGKMVRAEVFATVAEARARGLFHPGCRHSYSLWLPGVTRLPTGTADPQGDADRQKLRYLERQVRAAKRVEAVALDAPAKRAAAARVRERQKKLREHVDNSTAKRQSHRERLGAL